MKKENRIVVVTMLILAAILVGEAYAYLPSDYGYSSEATLANGTVDYGIRTNGSNVYDVLLLDNKGYEAPETLYVYRDPGFASNVNEDVAVEVGAQRMTQDYYIDQLILNLEYRGMTDVRILDASELGSALESDLTSSPVSKGLVMVSGAIPSNLFSGSSDDLLPKWVSQGGSLYWAGAVIGQYVAEGKDLVKVDGSDVFIGTNSFETEVRLAGSDAMFRSELSYEYNHLVYAPDLSSTSRTSLGAGYTDGVYDSVSLVSMGEGMVCIVAGEYNSKQIRDMSATVCSGLSPYSVVIGFDEGIVRESVDGGFDVSAIQGNISLYVSVGGYFCVYAQGYRFSI